jgi:hypothetical protein
MKRTKVLAEIKAAGWHGDMEKMTGLVAKNGIGVSASRKAYMDGQKAKERGEPCDCAKCVKEKGV